VNEKNDRHGFGTYTVKNGGAYEEHWENGYKHGKGILYNKDGNKIYEGDWKFGEPDGFGIFFNKKGDVIYNGEIKRGRTNNGIFWQDLINKL
jgi:hypothetical protein